MVKGYPPLPDGLTQAGGLREHSIGDGAYGFRQSNAVWQP